MGGKETIYHIDKHQTQTDCLLQDEWMEPIDLIVKFRGISWPLTVNNEMLFFNYDAVIFIFNANIL